MLVEKYIVVGIKRSRDVITDVIKQSSYDYSLIINPISIIKEPRRDVFVDFGSYDTKNQAFDRLNQIYRNVSDVEYWSILPIIEDVAIIKARKLKLMRLTKKIKRR